MITGKTNVVGIIGNPIEHSMSPLMHNAAFKYLNMDYVYIPFLVDKNELGNAITGAKSLNIKGLNITIPYKTDVMKHLGSVDTTAELIGAVNTIKFDENHVKGYNTDGIGAVNAIEEISSVKNKKIIVLGAGGAARAVSFQILLNGADKLVIANRTPENALDLQKNITEKLDADIECISLGKEIGNHLLDADILINTTPIGMYPNIDQEPLITSNMMHENLIVNDLVYNPLKTKLLSEAQKAGAIPLSGIKMLIYQGMESFRIWTGVNPPFDVFKNALDQI